MLATDVAYYIVRKGVPFRETHHISDRCVALSEKTDIPMNDLSYEQLKTVNERPRADCRSAGFPGITWVYSGEERKDKNSARHNGYDLGPPGQSRVLFYMVNGSEF
ncbi:Putative L-Aspartase, argininosuccinate lyase [Colletotrichum destructivum]|uniref:L-Aspartase, argininosuccinate lyase n=1 Tax=Colletotrichum destructivum TaxID=34406 RepID=A0AAX4ICE5_9PEZI|nr:Putative L-Aspartase, argininosuccinate lyase [Colletotrichum destructivum]